MIARAIAIAAVLLGAAGCKQADDRNPADRGAEGAAARDPRVEVPLPAGAVRVTGKNFHVDAAPLGACGADGACTVAADLTALGDFKVNREYPFKFVPDPGVTLDGAATFAHTGVHSGRLLVPVKRGAGPTKVSGAFKLSVCSADVCQVESAQLAVVVP